MTRPNRYLAWMAICILAVGGLAFLLQERLLSAFVHNPALNSGILAVLVIGIVFIFFQVGRLYPEVAWIDNYRHGGRDVSGERAPRLLAPMAAMIGDRRGRLNLSSIALRSLLDGINARLDESHEIARYLVALLIFLGLLGTFWGLLGTINSVGDAVGGLAVGSGDPAAMFAQLKEGLRGPLAGMGTAFGASMFGLAGSLVLGFLELQASQAHTRFSNELEEWLAGQTRLSTFGPSMEGEPAGAAYLQTLMDQTTAGLEALRDLMTRDAGERGESSGHLKHLGDQLALLSDHLQGQQKIVAQLADGQSHMLPAITKLLTAMERETVGYEEARRAHLRGIEGQAAPRAALPAPSGVEPLLRNTAESLEVLRHGMARSEAVRAQTNTYLKSLAEGIQAFGRQVSVVQHLLTQIAEGQAEMRPAFARVVDGGGRGGGSDETLRAHLRSIENYMSRMSEQSVPAHIQALLIQSSESLDRLHRVLGEGEQSRTRAEHALKALVSGIERLGERLESERPLLAKLVESQVELKPILQRLADGGDRGGGIDEMSRHHIRNIDAYLSRMLEEMSIGRQYTVQELRNEIKTLTRTIASLADQGSPQE